MKIVSSVKIAKDAVIAVFAKNVKIVMSVLNAIIVNVRTQ